jgi:hypothetical protein
MWHLNARENKINRWLNDSLATDGHGKARGSSRGEYNLSVRRDDGCRCAVSTASAGEWEKQIGAPSQTTAFVPPDTSARLIIVEAEGADEFDVAYYTDLVLAPNEQSNVYVETSHLPGILSAWNAYNTDFPDTVFYLTASVPETSFTCSRPSFETGCLDNLTGVGFVPCFAAVYKARTLVPHRLRPA